MRILAAALAALALAAAAGAQEPIRMGRTPDISPDGKLVAFSYLGDIWVVETIGGTAHAVTAHPAHDLALRRRRRGRQTPPRHLRLRQRSRLRLVARRQTHPVRLHAQHRLSSELRVVHRPR
jgi:hypothetical protein